MQAFTLVELLAVIGIMILIAAISAPSISTVLRGSQLTQGEQMLDGQLRLAWQTALTKNRSVEVRLYQFGDAEIPGETLTDPATGKYRALQLFEIQQSGTAVALGKVMRLPPSIIMDAGATLSSVIGSAQASPSVPTAATGATALSISNAGHAYNYVAFRFLPGGSTNLPSITGAPWFLTLHALVDQDRRTTPPANFITLQIDPTNGHIQTLRP